jgi:hypothetical protein
MATINELKEDFQKDDVSKERLSKGKSMSIVTSLIAENYMVIC